MNVIHIRKNRNLDYIVVLGCGINGEEVSHLLASRIDKGIEILQKNKHAKIIFSGGQGNHEAISEALAMKKYALKHGVDEKDILIEDQSKNTKENILNSKGLMTIPNPKIALVTTSYHVFRSLILAKKLGTKCIGFGAKTKFYFTLNAMIREFVGYLSISKKKHIVCLSVLSFLIIGIHIYTQICG